MTMLHWSDPSPFVNRNSGDESVGGPNYLDLPGSSIGLCTVSIGITGVTLQQLEDELEMLVGDNMKRQVPTPQIFVDINCDHEANPKIADGVVDDDDADFSLDNDDDDNDATLSLFTDGVHRAEPLIGTVAPLVRGVNIMVHFAYSRERHRFPERMKLFFFPLGGEQVTTLNPWDTESSSLFGHANAAGAFAVGAVFFRDTPAFHNEIELEYFSSAGGTPILFDPLGVALPAPEIRQKPDFSCVDGVDTTFFGSQINDGTSHPNFFGTSASAPAAAAIAALMLEAQPSLSLLEVYKILRETATDFDNYGFDFDSGYGLCNAEAAVQIAANTRPSHVVQAHANSIDFCTAHGAVTLGPCAPSSIVSSARKRVEITLTGKQRVTIQSHLDYKRIDHKDSEHCGLSTTLLVDGRIVWKSSDTSFTRSGSISGLAITDLLDGTHHAEQQVHLLDEHCKVHYSFTNNAIVVTKVDDIQTIELIGLSEESSSLSSSSSSSD